MSFFWFLLFFANMTLFLLLKMAQAKDPESAFFKKLDGFQQCEVTELKAGTHVFAVYGQFSRLLICLQNHFSSPFYIFLDSVLNWSNFGGHLMTYSYYRW